MNSVVLMGRLTKDPDIRYSQGAEPMCIARFTLAVDRRFNREQQEADFISCLAFGKTGQFIEKYLRKGIKVCMSGRIQTGSYQNREGKTVYTTDVIAEQVEFAESKNAQQTQQQPQQAYRSPMEQFKPQPYQPQYQQAQQESFLDIDPMQDDMLPWNTN